MIVLSGCSVAEVRGKTPVNSNECQENWLQEIGAVRPEEVVSATNKDSFMEAFLLRFTVARAAQAPTASLTLGASSRSGGFAEGSVGITSDFLRGADPVQVYERCVFERTGAPPIRPPVLRDL